MLQRHTNEGKIRELQLGASLECVIKQPMSESTSGVNIEFSNADSFPEFSNADRFSKLRDPSG